MPAPQPLRRPRRLRASHAIRTLTQETHLHPANLIAPIFVKEGSSAPDPISSMPNIFRYSMDDTLRQAEALHKQGIYAIALFPSNPADKKSDLGAWALDDENLINRTIRKLKKECPELLVVADVALDPYTTHGHDGVLNKSGTDVDNDETVHLLSQMAVLQAEMGADIVAPSDMMDGRVAAIRYALDAANHTNTLILSYAIKYASSFFSPFRDAVGSHTASHTYLDKRTYQMNPANIREALIEADLDEAEGADILMVKPAGLYLDVIHALRERTALPIAAYQVSGEYSMIHAAAQKGWLDLDAAAAESLISIKRAGADLILTYFAHTLANKLP